VDRSVDTRASGVVRVNVVPVGGPDDMANRTIGTDGRSHAVGSKPCPLRLKLAGEEGDNRRLPGIRLLPFNRNNYDIAVAEAHQVIQILSVKRVYRNFKYARQVNTACNQIIERDSRCF